MNNENTWLETWAMLQILGPLILFGGTLVLLLLCWVVVVFENWRRK